MNLFRNTLLLIFAFSSISLVAQSSFTKGVILSKTDSSIIVHAHIINITSKHGVTSNNNGEFVIQTNPEDTLLFSFIGYQSLKIKVSDIKPYTYLDRAIHTIEPYTVLPYKGYNEFREAFTKLELEDTSTFKINTSFVLSVEELRGYAPPSLGLLKYRNKDKENYKKLLARDKHKAFLATKFNAKIVQQTTLLKDEIQINSFMEYCDFTDQFIEFSLHYNLVDQIINCFEEYNSLPLANK